MQRFITPPYRELVTPEQYANAKKHWQKLIARQVSGGFDMERFTKDGGGREYLVKQTNVCGTVACNAGYLPETLEIPFEILIVKYENERGELNFGQLSKDYLGFEYSYPYQKGSTEPRILWRWCFSATWTAVDNSIKGAGIRMRIAYEQGVPIDWQEQMFGTRPLMYVDEL